MKTESLKQFGLKVTIPRMKILALFESRAQQHLSAEEVYQLLLDLGEEVSLATVYRVLTQFEAAKILVRHNFEDEHSVFELDTGMHHDHLVCLNCNTVVEFIDEQIEQRQNQIAEKNGFKLTKHVLTLYGFCQKCHNLSV